MQNKGKAISAAALAALMSVSVLPIYAEDEDSETKNITKDESVYTVLNADGSVESITVSDTLHSDEGFKDYKDESKLTDVENLKSDKEVTSTKNGYTWTSDDTDIYYQGKSTQDLPLNITITYKLNGKEYKPEDLLGKSGHLEMKIEVENTSKQTYTVDDKEYELVTPFVTAVGGMFDEDNFSNVEVNHGVVTSDSSHSIVAGVMIPGFREGLEEIVTSDIMDKLEDYLIDDITIEADVEDFASPTLMLAASTSTEDLEAEFEDTDFTTIFDQLDQLEDATNQLVTGAQQLYDGAVELNNGVGTLQDGTNQLATGASTLYDGSIELATGAGTLYAGLATLSSKSSELNSGVQQLADSVLAMINTSLAEQGLEQVTWSNYAEKFASEDYLNVTDAQIQEAKDTIKAQVEDAGVSVTDEQLNALIYMAAKNSDSSLTFEQKIANAGTELSEANALAQSADYLTAASYAKNIAAGKYTDAEVSSVLTSIAKLSATSNSTYVNAAYDTAISSIKSQVNDYLANQAASAQKAATVSETKDTVTETADPEEKTNETSETTDTDEKTNETVETSKTVTASAAKTAAAATASAGIDDATAAKILVYACNNSTGNMENDALKAASVILANPDGYSSDAMNDEKTLAYLQQQVSAKVTSETVNLSSVYSQVASAINQGDNTALVFAYACVKNGGKYDGSSEFFSKYSGDLVKMSTASTNLTNANQGEGAELVKGTLASIVKETEKSTLSSLSAQLQSINGANGLLKGVQDYTAAVAECASGAASLASGADQLASGSKELKDGIDQVNSGVGTLKSGSQSLADGAKTLKDGMEEYNDEAISKLTENDKLDDIQDVIDLFDVIEEEGASYNNYSGISDDTDGTVKFIYKVSGVKEEKKTTETEEVTEEKETFWDRLKGLFDFSSDDDSAE